MSLTRRAFQNLRDRRLCLGRAQKITEKGTVFTTIRVIGSYTAARVSSGKPARLRLRHRRLLRSTDTTGRTEKRAIADCFERIADDYAGHGGEVATLIEQCQQAIEDSCEGALGPWEQRELDYTRTAQRTGWLRLALTAAEKALLVSQLPPAEYAYGANYGQPAA